MSLSVLRFALVLIGSYFSALTLYQLISGKSVSLGYLWTLEYTRAEKPARYWLSMGLSVVLTAYALFLARCTFTLDCIIPW